LSYQAPDYLVSVAFSMSPIFLLCFKVGNAVASVVFAYNEILVQESSDFGEAQHVSYFRACLRHAFSQLLHKEKECNTFTPGTVNFAIL
jgi:hypothetical protein